MSGTELLKTITSVQDSLAKMQGEKGFVGFDLLNEEVYNRFHPFGMMGKDQIVGLRLMPPGGRKKIMYGIEDGKRVTLDVVRPGKFIGYIPANAPHHLDKEFGWWHHNGTEEFYLPIPLASGNSCLLLLEANPIDRVDVFAWYCQQCLGHLYSRESRVGRVGLDGYWRDEAAAIADFNGDKRLRKCADCGTDHPEAYSVFDPPERKLW